MQFVDLFFKAAFLCAGMSVIIHVLSGFYLMFELKKNDNSAWVKLNKPFGLITVTGKYTSLYNDYLDKNLHYNSNVTKIIKLGNVVIISRKFFVLSSYICIINLMLLIVFGEG